VVAGLLNAAGEGLISHMAQWITPTLDAAGASLANAAKRVHVAIDLASL